MTKPIQHLWWLGSGRAAAFILALGLSTSAMASGGWGGGGWGGGGGGDNNSPKNDFNIMMNYELGMHCTGFEFAYCCVLPPYNSILAQAVKTQSNEEGQGAFAKLLEGDPNVGLDGLGRETVLRDSDLSGGNFQKYVLTYEHEAQPRNDGRGKPQTSTLISAVEGNSLFMWSTVYDQAAINADGSFKVSGQDGNPLYNGVEGAVLGDGIIDPVKDSYANGWMNHLYIYADLEGSNPTNSTLEKDKIRLGLDNANASISLPLVFPPDCGPAAHPMGPVTKEDPFDPENTTTVPNDCGGYSNGNLLTFSTDHGTVVYTQMKVLENLPVTLTSPRIWEALGLPLTPFEDSIDFFGDPGLVDEDSIRPYVKMVARMHRFDSNDTTVTDGDAVGVGAPVMQNGAPVVGFGTAPIDIPNCERCHSNAPDKPNSPNGKYTGQWDLVQAEYNFWNTAYEIDTDMGDADWYSRLKSAAISMLYGHDMEHGTSFTLAYGTDGADPEDPDNPGYGSPFPQNTRLGHESVICQKCHADNVIAVVKSATRASDSKLIRPISEAIHRNHRNVTEDDELGDPGVIVFNDSLGRDGGCQGCHPAHRSDGNMEGYPITLDGENFYKNGDNRLASGGCFVGRDVHSNPGKDTDGAETPEHLNAVGAWLSAKVFDNQAGLADSMEPTRGIWCTNCHTQLGQEIWKAEDCDNLIEGDCVNNVRGGEVDPNGDVETPLNNLLARIGVNEGLGRAWLDPKVNHANGDQTHAIWKAADDLDPYTQDANVATIEIVPGGGPVVTTDADGNISVNILSFCTTPDCVATINANKTTDDKSPEFKNWRHAANPFIDTSNTAVAVPFSAATDGRDHWLSPGEPHCADCHAAPYTEQSGNINAFAPFNYPAKASLMRYSRGHRDITCQGCHESIHGLYPVTPSIDTTSYAQAASMNNDDSHGPLKCGACHETRDNGVHKRMDDLRYKGTRVRDNLDAAISWAHVFTDDHSPLDDMCQNCHDDERDEVSARNDEWQEHAMKGRASRPMMDQVEIELFGRIFGTNPDGTLNESEARNRLCESCHDDEWSEVSCRGEDGQEWKEHLAEGRVSPVVWEEVTKLRTRGSTCGW